MFSHGRTLHFLPCRKKNILRILIPHGRLLASFVTDGLLHRDFIDAVEVQESDYSCPLTFLTFLYAGRKFWKTVTYEVIEIIDLAL